MRLLSLDPCSQRCGWALMTDRWTMEGGGVLRPPRRDGITVEQRIDHLADELAGVIRDYQAQHVIIEMPELHARRHKGGSGKSAGASLMMYGWACGELRRVCIGILGAEAVTSVGSGSWSRTDKTLRGVFVQSEFSKHGYIRAVDRDLDWSDAIAIGHWFYQKEALCRT